MQGMGATQSARIIAFFASIQYERWKQWGVGRG